MTNATSLVALSTASLLSLHNEAIAEFGAPHGFDVVAKFGSKAKAVAAIEALCAAGNLAVSFDSGAAVIVDATPEDTGERLGDEVYYADGTSEYIDEAEAEAEADEADEVQAVAYGDGKGKVRAWGFALGSDEWLKANPRGTVAREQYRTARRKAARSARKAKAAYLNSAVE